MVSMVQVLDMFDQLTANLTRTKDPGVRDAVVLCLKTHANKNPEIMDKAITWADRTLSVPRESVGDHIQRAEAAHLIGYLKVFEQRGADCKSLGDKLLELAKDSTEEVEVRRRCIQSLGRINCTAAWKALNGLCNSLTDETLLRELNTAIQILLPSIQRQYN
jgi:hypothetical protein